MPAFLYVFWELCRSFGRHCLHERAYYKSNRVLHKTLIYIAQKSVEQYVTVSSLYVYLYNVCLYNVCLYNVCLYNVYLYKRLYTCTFVRVCFSIKSLSLVKLVGEILKKLMYSDNARWLQIQNYFYNSRQI